MLSVTATDALRSITHGMILDRNSLLERLKHSEEAIDHYDRSVLDRSVLKRCVDIPPQDRCGG